MKDFSFFLSKIFRAIKCPSTIIGNCWHAFREEDEEGVGANKRWKVGTLQEGVAFKGRLPKLAQNLLSR
jgi:hypothetical protein